MVFSIGGIVLIFLIPLLLTIVLFFVSRALFRLMMLVTTIIFIAMIILGIFVLKDAYALNAQLQNDNNAYVLQYNNESIAGFVLNMSEQHPLIMNKSQLRRFDNISESGKMPNGTVTNTFFVDLGAFDNATFNTTFNGMNYLDRNSIMEIMKSDNAMSKLAEIIAANDKRFNNVAKEAAMNQAESTIQDTYGSSSELKSEIFLAMFASVVNEQGPKFIFIEAKKKNLRIVPQRLTFRFINYVPDSVITASQELKA